MKSKALISAVGLLTMFSLVSNAGALAQGRRTVHLSGLINDYSPLSPTVKGSPWEMHPPGTGNRRLLGGHDHVRLWKNPFGCG